MNAVEIEEAVSALAERPFDRVEFPYQFLEAFGNKATTIKRLRTGASNKSDVGGVLQTSNIHLAVADPGEVAATLGALRSSPATTRGKAKFILATDGDTFEAEDLESGETVACAFADFPEHFGFFLSLAGITTVKQVRDSAFDIRSWANGFPYVNGGLFSGSLDVPKFSRIARSYLLHIGHLKWTQINPDIFGSMIPRERPANSPPSKPRSRDTLRGSKDLLSPSAMIAPQRCADWRPSPMQRGGQRRLHQARSLRASLCPISAPRCGSRCGTARGPFR